MGAALGIPAALLLSAGVGYLNAKRQESLRADAETKSIIGNLITKETLAGNPDIVGILQDPNVSKFIDKKMIPALQAFGDAQAKRRVQETQGMRGEQPDMSGGSQSATPTAPPQSPITMPSFAPPQAQPQQQAQAAPPSYPAFNPAENPQGQHPLAAPQPPAAMPSQAQPSATPEVDPINDMVRRSYLEPQELNPRKASTITTPLLSGGNKVEKAPDLKNLGSRVVQYGAQQGYPYHAIVDSIVKKGYEIPDDLKQYGEVQFGQAFRNQMAGKDPNDVLATKNAARQAFASTGYLPDKFKELVVPTAEDEGHVYRNVVLNALKEGRSMPEALKLGDSSGMRPNQQDTSAIVSRYAQEFRGALDRLSESGALRMPGGEKYSPEQLDHMASLGTGGLGMTEAQQAGQAKQAPITPGLAERTYTQTGQVPRLGALPNTDLTKPAPPGPTMEELRQQGLGEEVSQSRAKAQAAADVERGVQKRPDQATQDKAEAFGKASDALKRVEALYSPSYVGPGKGLVGGTQEKFGAMSAREIAFRQAVADYRNAAIFKILGKREPGQAAARVMGPRMDIAQDSATFESKLAGDYGQMKTEAEAFRKLTTSSGYTVPSFDIKETQPLADTTAKTRFDYLVSHIPEAERNRIAAMGDKAKQDPAVKEIIARINMEVKRGLVKP